MTEGERLGAVAALSAVALGWWLGVEAWHGWRGMPGRAAWLHATAPWLAAALLAVAFWLLINTGRLRRARGVASQHPWVREHRHARLAAGEDLHIGDTVGEERARPG